MKSIFSTIIILLLLCASCTKEDNPRLKTNEEGEIISLPIVWKKNLHLSVPEFNGKLNYPIYFKGNPIIPMTNGRSGRMLAMIEQEKGKLCGNGMIDLFLNLNK